jgi:L-asparagine transporter-like permease
MESQSDNRPAQPVDPVAAFQVANDAQSRMAARVRSPWWVHLLRGALVVAVVFGLSGPDDTAWLLLGVVGLISLSQWRVRVIGLTRSNPERWKFLALGAPWSIIALVVTVAAMTFVVLVRNEPAWQIAVVVIVAGVVTVALGPLADAAARRRLAGDVAVGLPGGGRR